MNINEKAIKRYKNNYYIGTSKEASSTYSWARRFRDFQQTSKLFVEDLNVATSDCANEVDT